MRERFTPLGRASCYSKPSRSATSPIASKTTADPARWILSREIAVIKAKTSAGKVEPRSMDGFVRLIEQKYFTVDRFEVPFGEIKIPATGPACLVSLSGWGTVKSAHGSTGLKPGQAVVLPEGTGDIVIDAPAPLVFVRCMAPAV